MASLVKLKKTTAYLSGRKIYSLNFSVFAVDARGGDANFRRGAPSWGLECVDTYFFFKKIFRSEIKICVFR